MILAMTLAAFASIFAKALTVDMHVFQVLWLRLVLGCLLMAPMVRRRSGSWLPRFGRLHMLRAVILIGMTGLWFYALSLGPVTQAAALSYTYPIFTLVFAAVFFGEKIRSLDVISIALCFVGVAIVFQKGWTGVALGRNDIIQLVVVLGSSLLIAIRMSLEKVMTSSADPEDILLGSMMIATVIVLPAAFPVWVAITWTHFWLLVGLAVTATLAQLFVIRLISMDSWSIVSIFAFWEVLAAIFLGILIFSESLSVFGIAGAALIVIGGFLQVGRK